MRGDGAKLTPKQMQAVLLLIEPSTDSYGQLAAKLGVSARTLRRWRKLPAIEIEVERAWRARLEATKRSYLRQY